MVRLSAVVERPVEEKPPGWPAIDATAPGWIHLHAKSTPEEIAALVWQLAAYNRVREDAPDAAGVESMAVWVDAIVAEDSLILPGGIGVFESEGRSILPGCCTGLEGWREWFAFAGGGESPWLGHDPWPGLVRSGGDTGISR